MKKFFYILIIIQLLLIIYITNIIRNRNTFDKMSVNLIDKESLVVSQSSNLKFFYEPKANFRQKVTKDWLPYQPEYTINNDALNERFDYSIEKSAKIYRIIALGDSFTFGQNVSTDRNWTELIEDKFNKNLDCPLYRKIEVINLGVKGYDTQYEVERFKVRGIKYNPDLVIWTFTDFERILEKTMPYILKHKEEAIILEKQGIYYKNWKDARENLEKKIGKAGFNNYLKEQLEKFNDLYDKKLLLMALPNNQIYIDTLGVFVSQRANTNFFKPSIKWEQKEYFLPDLHFNDLGHQKMAAEVLDYLNKNKLFPCN